MKKVNVFTLILFIISCISSYGQESDFKNLNDSSILPKLIKNCVFDSKKGFYYLINTCSNSEKDSIGIRLDTVIYYKTSQSERALVIAKSYDGGGHFGETTTNFLTFTKNAKQLWENDDVWLNVTELSEWQERPNYKLLQLSEDEFGLLVYIDGAGNQGYFSYMGELFSLELGIREKLFQLYSLDDTSGALPQNECVELHKNIFTKKMPNGQYYLCVSTKGHIAKMKKVNYVDYFKFEEEHNFFMKVKREHLK